MGLPKIIRFLATHDSPDSQCPHCGASGRYILTFQLEDGTTKGAMRGCVKLFPVSPIAWEEQRLRDKLTRYRKNGWNGLNRADTEALQAIDGFYAGTKTEAHTMGVIRAAKQINSAKYRAKH